MALNRKVALITGGVKNQPRPSPPLRQQRTPSIKVRFYQGNLTSAGAVTRLFQDVLEDFEHIDIVMNTVGKVLKPITAITEEEYDTMFAVNSKTAFFVLKEAAVHVTDAPVEHFTRGVCKELQSRRVSVNNITPGPMDTPFFYPRESPEAVEFHKANGMGNRLTMVEDIAPIVRFLCTDGAWITDQTIFTNGGYTTR
ncbi:hypothetical protein BDV28DRAFT_157634 [Aspergillus coremiiformis]|uniref:Short-chain dehydrogenase n=1 Tax=Aspergillus coremiiformis TaxID=138285 RepID=A0A5N6Z503_9EURO|nr:hypothetical protein BDV28DRAFT_157634 [Aspergillus coremiiformis]